MQEVQYVWGNLDTAYYITQSQRVLTSKMFQQHHNSLISRFLASKMLMLFVYVKNKKYQPKYHDWISLTSISASDLSSLTWQNCHWPGWSPVRSASLRSASRRATESCCTVASAPERCVCRSAACGDRAEPRAAEALRPRAGRSLSPPACPADRKHWRAGCWGWTAGCRPHCTGPRRNGWVCDPVGWCRRKSPWPGGRM